MSNSWKGLVAILTECNDLGVLISSHRAIGHWVEVDWLTLGSAGKPKARSWPSIARAIIFAGAMAGMRALDSSRNFRALPSTRRQRQLSRGREAATRCSDVRDLRLDDE